MPARSSAIASLLLTIVVLAGLMNPSPVSMSGSGPAVAAASRDQNESDQGEEKGKGKDDKEKKDKSEQKEKGSKNTAPVDAARSYAVNVGCEYQPIDQLTTCSVEGLALENAKKVGQLVVPEDELCTTVSGNDGTYVDPDPHAHVVGYRSQGSTGKIALVLAGSVSVGGTATYWIKAGGDVFPVRGPGLVCLAAVTTEETATAPSGLTDSTGALLVQTYTCALSTPPPDYDWFGACMPAGTESTYRLAAQDGTGNDRTDAADGSGEVEFGNLEPGLYDLTRVNKNWCHAESDNVDAQGNVVIKAGERTTVWIFSCDAAGS